MLADIHSHYQFPAQIKGLSIPYYASECANFHLLFLLQKKGERGAEVALRTSVLNSSIFDNGIRDNGILRTDFHTNTTIIAQ